MHAVYLSVAVLSLSKSCGGHCIHERSQKTGLTTWHGAGGLGLLIDAMRTFCRSDRLWLIILEILVVVIDTASDAIRRLLV